MNMENLLTTLLYQLGVQVNANTLACFRVQNELHRFTFDNAHKMDNPIRYRLVFSIIEDPQRGVSVSINMEHMAGEIENRAQTGLKIIRNIFLCACEIIGNPPRYMTSYPINNGMNKGYYTLNFRAHKFYNGEATTHNTWLNIPYSENIQNNFLPLCDNSIYNNFINKIENI